MIVKMEGIHINDEKEELLYQPESIRNQTNE